MWNASLRPKYLVLVIGLLVVVGCVIDTLTGPASVILGGTATYSMRIRPSVPDNGPTAEVTAVVVMDVPIGWAVASSSYSGTANGAPISGIGNVVSSNATTCDVFHPPAGPQYQRIYISTAVIPTVVYTDSATLSVTFNVRGDPGSYTLRFWGDGGSHVQMSPRDCQMVPATIAVSALVVPAIPAVGSRGIGILAAVLAATALAVLRACD